MQAQELRIVRWCVAVVAVMLLACLFTWTWMKQRTVLVAQDAAVQFAQTLNSAFVDQTQRRLAAADQVLRSVRYQFLQTRSIDKTRELIDALDLSKSGIHYAFITDAAGRLVLTLDVTTAGRSVAERQYFVFHREHDSDVMKVSPVEFGKATGAYFMRLTRGIRDADGTFLGVVLVTISPDQLAADFQRFLHAETMVAGLIGTDDRRLRARWPAPPAEVWSKPLETPLWEEMERKTQGTYASVSPVDKRSRQYVFQRVPNHDLVMTTGIDQDELDLRVSREMKPVTMGVAISFLIVLLATGAIGGLLIRRGELDRLTRTDELTGVLNRRGVLDLFEIELARSVRTKGPISLLLLDIDHFKRINDQWGHATGDTALREFTKAVRKALRATDHLGRVGGEEFLVVAADTSHDGARALAERILEAVRQCKTIRSGDGETVNITTSIGISVVIGGTPAMERAIAAADAALYQAKATGRNKTVVADVETMT